MHQKDNCHKDRGPTVNKAIIVSRHVGRRYPTTNQRNTKMIVILMIMIIVIIIINIIMSMGLPTCRGEPPNPHHATGGEGGEPPKPTPEPHHTTGRGEATHNHTTPQGGGRGTIGGGGGGGGAAEPGSYVYRERKREREREREILHIRNRRCTPNRTSQCLVRNSGILNPLECSELTSSRQPVWPAERDNYVAAAIVQLFKTRITRIRWEPWNLYL